MNTVLYWKVSKDGQVLFTTSFYADTPENRTVGRVLRKAFRTADGYSVVRVTKRLVS